MKVKELKKNIFIKAWLKGIKAKKTTEETYLQGMQEFTEYIGKTPDKLIIEAEQEIREGLLLRERKLMHYIPDFRAMLEERVAPLTVRNRVNAVKSFYKFNNIQIPALPRSLIQATPEKKHKEIPTKKAIGEILKFCNPLEKALILVGATSGLSAADICELRISDFTKGLDPETGVTTISIVRRKTDYDFTTFLTPEATEAVRGYLKYRSREVGSNNNIRRKKQLLKQRVTTDEGFLFIAQSVPNSYLVTSEENLRQLSEGSLQEIYRRLNERAQKNSPKGEYNIIRSHNLRRFFNSTLIAKKVPIINVDYMLGHKIDRVHEAYFRADIAALKEDYLSYIPWLTFAEELDVTVSPEFKRVIEENDKLKAEITRVDVERSEFQELREEIKKLKKAQEEKEALKTKFGPILEKERNWVHNLDKTINWADDEAVDAYIEHELKTVPAEIAQHRRNLENNSKYREEFEIATGSQVEKQEQELKTRALKTLAEQL